jgi:hypothetical protein
MPTTYALPHQPAIQLELEARILTFNIIPKMTTRGYDVVVDVDDEVCGNYYYNRDSSFLAVDQFSG